MRADRESGGREEEYGGAFHLPPLYPRLLRAR
jgi:hypothetical protein